MQKVFLDRDDNILGWCDDGKDAAMPGTARTIVQDMTGFDLDTSKVSGSKIVLKSTQEIEDIRSASEADAAKEKKIVLQMRIDAMTKLTMDNTAEKAALGELS